MWSLKDHRGCGGGCKCPFAASGARVPVALSLRALGCRSASRGGMPLSDEQGGVWKPPARLWSAPGERRGSARFAFCEESLCAREAPDSGGRSTNPSSSRMQPSALGAVFSAIGTRARARRQPESAATSSRGGQGFVAAWAAGEAAGYPTRPEPPTTARWRGVNLTEWHRRRPPLHRVIRISPRAGDKILRSSERAVPIADAMGFRTGVLIPQPPPSPAEGEPSMNSLKAVLNQRRAPRQARPGHRRSAAGTIGVRHIRGVAPYGKGNGHNSGGKSASTSSPGSTPSWERSSSLPRGGCIFS